MQEAKLELLEQGAGYRFQNKELLKKAMRHSSYANEHHMERLDSNERLEFLGDAVLEVVASEFLYRKYPHYPEGQLTKLRASMVCEQTLALCARELGLGQFLLLGKGEESTGGRMRPSITSDAMEALIGAIFLDGGFSQAKEAVHRLILNGIEEKKLFHDSKTILQEIIQEKYKEPISYELLEQTGPSHKTLFTVRAMRGEEELGRGQGQSKKMAEQDAAYQAILKIQQETR